MNLDVAFTAKSEPIVLADISKKFAKLEGDIERDQRVSVVVHTVTSDESIKRAALNAKRETKYTGNVAGGVEAISEVYDDNPEYRKMLECYWTVDTIANLNYGTDPVFKRMPLRDIPQGEFIKVWGGLPPEVTQAIHAAVLQHNPVWDPTRLGE